MTDRELPPRFREKAHEKLDEILDSYEAGAELWLVTTVGFVSTSHPEIELILTIKDKPLPT
jgi:hypothetical protein